MSIKPIRWETAFGFLGQSQPGLRVRVAACAGLLDPHGTIYKRLQLPIGNSFSLSSCTSYVLYAITSLCTSAARNISKIFAIELIVV